MTDILSIRDLTGNDACESIEREYPFAPVGGMKDEDHMFLEWADDQRRQRDAEFNASDEGRNAAECDRLRQLAERDAAADDVTGEFLAPYVERYVSAGLRLSAERKAEGA